MSLQGKVAIVAGDSRGIGKAACLQLAKLGAKVVACGFEQEAAADTVVSDIVAGGGAAAAIPADVHSEEGMQRLVETVKQTFGRVDILVCNAGNGTDAAASFAELSWETFQRQLVHELRAAFQSTKAVIPVMKEQQSGRIIYVTATEGRDPLPQAIAFGTAMGGLDAFARYIAQEFGPSGITANVVAPGFVRVEGGELSREEAHVIGSFTPMGRMAEPKDVAGVIAFLAGDGAAFLTGTYTPVTGGLVME